MARLRRSTVVAVLAILVQSCAHRPPDSAAGLAANRIALPNSATAVAMEAPVLPGRVAGDCPSSDRCEFGARWRACEAIPVYRQAREGSPLLRTLAANETFVATRGEIELVAPGEVVMLEDSDRAMTGGLALAKGSRLAAYGPVADARAVYFDPSSGMGWSPPPASESFWWDDKVATLIRAPSMTWWVEVRLNDKDRGWLQLKSVPDRLNFPMYYTAQALLTWDVDMVRDDESPDCAGMLEITRGLLGN